MTAFGASTLSYDANGNLTSDGTNTYIWDARNQLTAISGATTASFTYDAFGRRTSKTVAGTSTQFLYDWLNSVQEIQGGVASANLLTGLRTDEYFARSDSGDNLSTLLTDLLGSTIGLVGSAQTIETSYSYEPFGATTTAGAANGNTYQFTGRENDGTGLYFYRSRYYSPTFQRFVAQDPIGFGGGTPNLYGYVFNDPLSLTDPRGLFVLYGGGGESSATGSSGQTSSSGGYWDSSNGYGQYQTNGSLEGAGEGANVSGGYYSGDITGFSGWAWVYNLSLGFVDFTYSSNAGGWGVSFGTNFNFGLPIGVTTGTTNTNVTGPSGWPSDPSVVPELRYNGPEFRRPCQ